VIGSSVTSIVIGTIVSLLERSLMKGVVKGKTVGIDATTLEANAASRSIARLTAFELQSGSAPRRGTHSRARERVAANGAPRVARRRLP
jgi:hypothetical protein